MEIDHFDPRQKGKVDQDFFNLNLATRHCNSAKSDFWPTKSEHKAGLRLLNPTREMDWGIHIVEDPETHLLWGKTPTGIFHIRKLDLNARHLVEERRDRARLQQLLHEQPIQLRTIMLQVPETVPEIKRLLEQMIRPIPSEALPDRHPSKLYVSAGTGFAAFALANSGLETG